jgi:bifunctional UDP-N-acetylglucosamine pyrophosphorylase/glucosamine-1-phosphate N-acetyltransferase
MKRLLVVPAAGRGSRLGSSIPKALVKVNSRPMLQRLIDAHRRTVDHIVVVIAPDTFELFDEFRRLQDMELELVVQDQPTGMLDAIHLAEPIAARVKPERILVTWCDQIGVTPATIGRLDARSRAADAPALVFPTFVVSRPYIHFDRDATGRIVGVRQRREGDLMPESGETDMGLFDMSLEAYVGDLGRFAQASKPSSATGERNFLPFIPWLASRKTVETIPGTSAIEVLGVNTPDDLAAMTAHLAEVEQNSV